ncbi:MAG: hypothetical protein FWE01_02745 [Firmicutes bacterium]|nr:hypothetical protein [Bacillota bacterium]
MKKNMARTVSDVKIIVIECDEFPIYGILPYGGNRHVQAIYPKKFR